MKNQTATVNQQIQSANGALVRVDSAWAACAERLSAPDLRGLVDLHETLERRREQVAAGDTLAILQALAQCAEWSLPAPAWLAKAFCTRLEAFTNCSPGPATRDSLDDIFRSPVLRAGQAKRTAKDRADWALGSRLWGAVREIAHRHRGLDPALKEVLRNGRWSVKLRRAGELVTLVDKTHVHLSSGQIPPLSRLWAKSCKRVTNKEKAGEIAQSG